VDDVLGIDFCAFFCFLIKVRLKEREERNDKVKGIAASFLLIGTGISLKI
jgi:hypothetical protein